MILMNVILSFGGMDLLRSIFGPPLQMLGLPGDCAAPLVMQFVHFSAGYASVAALLASDAVTEKQALITLLIGSMAVITSIAYPCTSLFLAGSGRVLPPLEIYSA